MVNLRPNKRKLVAWRGRPPPPAPRSATARSFVSYNHVVQDNTRVHDVGDILNVPKPRRGLHNVESALKDTKSSFDVFPSRLLMLRKKNPSLLLWIAERLHESRPPWVDTIGEIVTHVVCISVDGEVDRRCYTIQNIIEEW